MVAFLRFEAVRGGHGRALMERLVWPEWETVTQVIAAMFARPEHLRWPTLLSDRVIRASARARTFAIDGSDLRLTLNG